MSKSDVVDNVPHEKSGHLLKTYIYYKITSTMKQKKIKIEKLMNI